jgi:hypothetical protein
MKNPEQEYRHLLKERFEVIADFPDNNYGPTGTILDRDWGSYPDGEDNPPLWNISKFPHLFKKLEWWEKRKESEMPKYVKQTGMVDGNDKPIPDRYFKVKKHFSAGNGEWRDDSYRIFCIEKNESVLGSYFNYSDYEPATEEEYLNSLNSKP